MWVGSGVQMTYYWPIGGEMVQKVRKRKDSYGNKLFNMDQNGNWDIQKETEE